MAARRSDVRGGRPVYDLDTTHVMHPPDGGMLDVTRRLATAVALHGHLLVVAHAPSATSTDSTSHRRAMFLAKDLLLTLLNDDFEALVVDQRPRTMVRDGTTVGVHDSTPLAQRRS